MKIVKSGHTCKTMFLRFEGELFHCVNSALFVELLNLHTMEMWITDYSGIQMVKLGP